MNLDDLKAIQKIDQQNMYAHITGLPTQLESAWQLGQTLDLPRIKNIKNILIAGMGGSAIGADLLSAYVQPDCPIPLVVQREYELPAWANGPETLVIASSHSGNTEETLSVFEQAVHQKCSLFSLTRGGKLLERSRQVGAPAWTFEHDGQPRSAVGFSFGLLLAALARLGIVPDPSIEVTNAVQAMRSQQSGLKMETPIPQNLAKQLANLFYGRIVMVLGSNRMAPVARRWKGQIAELSKAWAQFEFLPEADHNTLAGIFKPQGLSEKVWVYFLRSSCDHPRNRQRAELTRQQLALESLASGEFEAFGSGPMAHMWTAIHLGDFMAYYLAMLYEVDPTPIPAIENFKKAMS